MAEVAYVDLAHHAPGSSSPWILTLVPEKSPGSWATINVIMFLWSSFILVTIFLDTERDEFREELYLSW
eukprot:symbB.v1.2.031900.t1/scaffold3752.1/size50888/3